MAISGRLGVFSVWWIQSNPKWEDYHNPPLSPQVPTKCICCREDPSPRDKKKISLPDRTCQYCGKEFSYPSILKRHLKLKNTCSNQISLATDQISPTSDRVSSTSGQISLTSSQISLASDQISLTSDRVNSASDRISPTSNLISPVSDQASPTSNHQISEKNMVPIRLTLA